MNLADYKASTWSRFENNTLFYPSGEVLEAVNEVVDISNLFAGHYQGEVQIPGYSIANQFIYELPDNVLFPLAVWFEGVELEKTTIRGLAGRSRRWLSETTASTGMPVNAWAPLGLRKIVIYPADAIGGNDIRVFGVLEPPELVNDGDPVRLPTGFEDIALEYAAHLLPFKEGGKPFADSTKVLPQFQRKLKEQMRWTRFSFPRFWIERTQEQG